MNSELRELYQEVILDHNKRPRNRGKLEGATHRADGHNPLCGDEVHVTLVVHNDRVQDVRFEGQGCAISTASASLMTEAVMGKTLPEAHEVFLKFHQMVAEEGASVEFEDDLMSLNALGGVKEFPARVKCASLAWHTLEAALSGEGRVSTE